MLASGLFFPTLLGIWWKRMNSSGALAGLIVGVGSYLFLLWGTGMPSLSQVTVSIPLSLLACIVVSLMTKPPRMLRWSASPSPMSASSSSRVRTT